MLEPEAPGQFWLFRWLEQHGISHPLQLRTLLSSSRSARHELQDEATRHVRSIERVEHLANGLATGARIDLSARTACRHLHCRQRDIEELFSRVSLYFDTVVVADVVSHRLADEWTGQVDRELLRELTPYIIIKNMGCASLVYPFPKYHLPVPSSYGPHGTYGYELGRRLQEVLEGFATEGKLEINSKAGTNGVIKFTHPDVAHSQFFPLEDTDAWASVEPTKLFLQKGMQRYGSVLAHGLATAHRLGVPMGAVNGVERAVLHGNVRDREAEVALDLDLPITQGLPPHQLLRIRAEERDAFVRFRSRLRQAIGSLVSEKPNETSKQLATEIRGDVVEPALAEIRMRLRSAERKAGAQSAAAFGIGTLPIVCGVGPELGLTAAATGLAVRAASEYYDAQQSVQLNDMYFLWRASQR